MGTEDTRQRILDAAEKMFAARGYAGTSIRELTAEAGVSLPAIHYHCGSKELLFREVLARCFAPLDRARLDWLDELEKRLHPDAPPVEELVRALVEPALARAKDPAHGTAWLRLIARLRMEEDHWSESLPQLGLHMKMLRRYTAAFRRALPGRSPSEVRTAMFFMICTIANALVDDKTLPLLGSKKKSVHEAPERMGETLVRFVSAGIRAAHEEAEIVKLGAKGERHG